MQIDTIRMVTDTKFISQINDTVFKNDVDLASGEIISSEYRSKNYPAITPYELYIRANFRSNKMTIEFSSKILLVDYPLLICSGTFRQCLSNIESLGLCRLDIDGIIGNCYFNKLHIVRDIDLELTTDILGRLNQCTGDYRRYKWSRYKDGILFTRNVKAVDCREAITLYNKEVEITLPRNDAFLIKTGAAHTILDHFIGKTRLEVQLESKRKIKKELGIEDTDFHSVMNCRKNIVLHQFDKIFGSDALTTGEMKINNIVDYGLWNIIRYHNFSLQSIEQEIKDLRLYEDKTKGAMGKQMKKIKAMMQAYLNQNHAADSVIDGIRKLLQ